MIDACRGVFNNFLPDVWILADNFKDKNKDQMYKKNLLYFFYIFFAFFSLYIVLLVME